eukprot:m.640429 g.640429  ORF g.640429 m.640429 type:complete len:673 (+) comp58340_c1_seq2:219-2237(+)
MSKLSFRARALDASKAMPIYHSQQEPDVLNPTTAINRAVLQLPTGMEKDEEEEHHIQVVINQQAISTPLHTQIVIPTPEASIPAPNFAEYYSNDYKAPKTYARYNRRIRGVDPEVPEYDIDTDDEGWLSELNAKRGPKGEIEGLAFEIMMDRIDTASKLDLITESVALDLLPEYPVDDIKLVYKYYASKFAKQKRLPLTLYLKEEKVEGATSKDPYICFRRRTEKMQTRKNRKTEETSFINMLKLKRDLLAARHVTAVVAHRETTKRQLLTAEWAIIESRFQLQDWTGALLERVTPLPAPPPTQSARHPFGHSTHQPSSHKTHVAGPLHAASHGGHKPASDDEDDFQSDPALEDALALKRRKRKRREELRQLAREARDPARDKQLPAGQKIKSEMGSSLLQKGLFRKPLEKHHARDLESVTESSGYQSDDSSILEPEFSSEPFPFIRKRNALYHCPWEDPMARDDQQDIYTYLDFQAQRPRLFGHCRSRVGRGGRIFIDRASSSFDCFDELAPFDTRQAEDSTEFHAQLQMFPSTRAGFEPSQPWPYLHLPPPVPQLPLSLSSSSTTAAIAHSTAGASFSKSVSGGRAPAPPARSSSATAPARLPSHHVQLLPARGQDLKPAPQDFLALPLAGTDFGSGGEDIASGPKVMLQSSGQWTASTNLKPHHSHPQP